MKFSKSSFLSILKYIITLSVAAGLLWTVFRKVDWEEFADNLLKVDYSWVIASMILSSTSYLARAYRWTLLINPFGYRLKTGRALLGVFTGYLVNLALPRVGEVTRCAVLNKNDGIPIPLSIGTVVTERIFDLLMLIVFFGLTFIFEFDILYRFFEELFSKIQNPENLIYIVLGIGLVMIVIYLLFRKAINRFLSNSTLAKKIITFIKGLWQGFLSFKKIENKIGFIVSTILIWIAYFLMTYLITFSMPETENLGVLASMSMLVGAGVALAIPVQGGFGTYHLIITILLTFYGLHEKDGTFFATLLHTSQIIVTFLFGVISIIISLLIKRRSNAKHAG